MIGIPVHSVLSSDWRYQPGLSSRLCPDLPLDKTYPTGGSLRVFKLFAWLGVDSDKIALSRPAHQRVTRAVETVEKVPFQKMIFEKWERNAEKRLVLDVPHNISAIIWQF